MLLEIERQAKQEGYRTISIETHEDRPLGPLIAAQLRSLLYELDRAAGAGDKVKRGLRVLRSFISGPKLTVGDVTLGLDIDPEQGSADSGDLEVDLPNLFVAIGEAADERQSAVALFIDEIQYFSSKELGALSQADAAKALQEPAQAAGVRFEDAALNEIFEVTQGYPYLLQEWGYQAWNLAQESPIALAVIQAATGVAIPRLDKNFFRVRFDRLTPSEKKFLRAMAELGPAAHRSGDVAHLLGAKVTSLGPVRAKLIKKGMIYSPAHGDLAFTVPLFDEFMRRTMPTIET